MRTARVSLCLGSALLLSGLSACDAPQKQGAAPALEQARESTAAKLEPSAQQAASPRPERMETCGGSGSSCADAPKQAPLATTPGTERKLGAEPKLAGEPVPVAQVLSAPEPYLGKPVKCQGKVARVCQAAGCWLELQADSGGEGLRVPMAGHAFFVPQDAVGHTAIVEGELRRHELPEGQRKHYEGEGMKAVGPLALEATSVVLR